MENTLTIKISELEKYLDEQQLNAFYSYLRMIEYKKQNEED